MERWVRKGHYSNNTQALPVILVSNMWYGHIVQTTTGFIVTFHYCRRSIFITRCLIRMQMYKIAFSQFLNWVYINTSHNSLTVFPSATLCLGADTNQIIMRERQLKVTDQRCIRYWGSCDSAEPPVAHLIFWNWRLKKLTLFKNTGEGMHWQQT